MGGDGVVDPIATLRAAVDAGRDANEAPILALARGVDATAIRWASEVGRLVIVHDFHDGTRMRLVIHTCLDRIARVDVRASRGSRPPGG